jgi:hypothetical protein
LCLRHPRQPAAAAILSYRLLGSPPLYIVKTRHKRDTHKIVAASCCRRVVAKLHQLRTGSTRTSNRSRTVHAVTAPFRSLWKATHDRRTRSPLQKEASAPRPVPGRKPKTVTSECRPPRRDAVANNSGFESHRARPLWGSNHVRLCRYQRSYGSKRKGVATRAQPGARPARRGPRGAAARARPQARPREGAAE